MCVFVCVHFKLCLFEICICVKHNLDTGFYGGMSGWIQLTWTPLASDNHWDRSLSCQADMYGGKAMLAEVGLPCVTFLTTLILSPGHSGLHVWPLSGASRVMAQRGVRPSRSVCFSSLFSGNWWMLYSKCNMRR